MTIASNRFEETVEHTRNKQQQLCKSLTAQRSCHVTQNNASGSQVAARNSMHFVTCR